MPSPRLSSKISEQLCRRVLLAAEMARVDAFAIDTIGISGAVLMEQAGKAVAEKCKALLMGAVAPRVVIVCGRGNNGGDGFVVARHLAESGVHCKVFLLGEPESLAGDAKRNLEIWQRLGNKAQLFDKSARTAIAAADLIVDAMLGTGAKGALRDNFQIAARAINASDARVVAVDLPTGVDADTGAADADAIRAHATVTFGALKIGLLFSPGRECAGELSVADIGFPTVAFAQAAVQTYLLEAAGVCQLLPRRARAAFKNQCGQVYVIAGSDGMGGAAYLSGLATLRAGAGLVILGAPASVAARLEGRLVEVIKEPLAERDGALAVEAWQKVEPRMVWADVIAIGPGLGTGEGASFVLRQLIEKFRGILVIDADGLNLLRGAAELLRNRNAPTIITPHPGEFSRVFGLTKEDILARPGAVAREMATRHKVHLLLKGAPSVAALPDGRVYINGAGNPGMATAGMGDVLTGTIAGLAGQTQDTEKAVLAGMFLHSFAADLAAAERSEIALTAGDVLDMLPKAFLHLDRQQNETAHAQ